MNQARSYSEAAEEKALSKSILNSQFNLNDKETQWQQAQI